MPKPVLELPKSQIKPDPRFEKRTRRKFTANYKLQIITEAAATENLAPYYVVKTSTAINLQTGAENMPSMGLQDFKKAHQSRVSPNKQATDPMSHALI